MGKDKLRRFRENLVSNVSYNPNSTRCSAATTR